jgi:hypothetical protein
MRAVLATDIDTTDLGGTPSQHAWMPCATCPGWSQERRARAQQDRWAHELTMVGESQTNVMFAM